MYSKPIPVNDLFQLGRALQPVKVQDRAGVWTWGMSEAFKFLRKLHRLHFQVSHRHKENDPKDYIIRRFTFDPKYGEEGANAETITFTPKGGDEISVKDHFKKKYNLRLNYPKLPVIETARNGFFPMEVCTVKQWQRYNFKLSPDQVCTSMNCVLVTLY